MGVLCWQCKRRFPLAYRILTANGEQNVCRECKGIYFPDLKPLAKLVQKGDILTITETKAMPPKGSKKKAARPRWTVVQHSGFGYGGKTEFEKALETRQLDTEADQQLVLKVGGKLFDSYGEATAYEEGNVGTGFVPQAPGTFSEEKVDGLRIYIPPTG